MLRIISIATIIAGLSGCGEPAPALPTIDGAYSECKTLVLKALKAPATAVFASVDDIEAVSIDLTEPEGLITKEFKILGYVDSHNTFGANLRTSFSCNVTGWQGNVWAVSELKEV